MAHPIFVLVVEDEPLIRMDIVDQLLDRGFSVLEAANSQQALEMLVSHPEIQILFTDIDMPGGMDGLMLAAAVRDRWPPIRIIVTSGHRRPTPESMPTESRFISKPHRPEDVATAIREMVA